MARVRTVGLEACKGRQQSAVRTLLMRVLLLTVVVAAGAACTGSEREKVSGGAFDFGVVREGTLADSLTLMSKSATPNDGFGHVIDILPLPNGTVWVLASDSMLNEANPSIRAFDSTGKFLRPIGATGTRPGEYQQPYGMALLNNGQVALRDRGLSDRIVLFNADGSAHADMVTDGRTSWPKLGYFQWIVGRSDAIRSDDFGVIWLPFDGHLVQTDSGATFTAQYARVRPGGQFIDVVDSPDAPVVRSTSVSWTRRLSGGGTSVRGLTVPHQPGGTYAWSPRGNFAVARTDQYQIDELEQQVAREPGDHTPFPPLRIVRSIKRSVPKVSVTGAERDSIVSGWRKELALYHAESLVTLPKPAVTKPEISNFQYADDGQVLVWVSQPSKLVDGVWTEPQVVDVFDKKGNFTGQLTLPHHFTLIRMHGNVIWGVSQRPARGAIPQRFTVRW